MKRGDSTCSRKLQRSLSAFECDSHAVGAMRYVAFLIYSIHKYMHLITYASILLYLLSYRVEMVVSDDIAEGTFVCFDGLMTKLDGLRASEAIQLLVIYTFSSLRDYHITVTDLPEYSSEYQAGEGVNPEDSELPPFIADMEGKSYTFQVGVTSYNFTPNHQTFTVSRIINVIDRVPAPDFVDNVSVMCIMLLRY